MTARLAALALLVAVAGCHGPRLGGSAPCTHLQASRQLQGLDLCEDVWTCVRPPGGRFDRLGLHRFAPCEPTAGPVVVYLPGMHMNGELAVREPRYDLRLYLAAAGIRTWGVDWRTHVVPPDASADELRTLAGWDTNLFVDDAAWAAAFVRGNDPGPIVLAGFSQGAALAYRLAARRGESVTGLVILDGALGAGRRAGEGGPAVDVGGTRLPYEARKNLLATVEVEPSLPSPIPEYPNAGKALAEILYGTASFGGQGGLANTRDDLSDIRILARLLAGYDRWWPRAALDAPDPMPARPLPVLAFASTRLGPEWVARVHATAERFGGAAARVRELPNYGHLDVLVGRRAAREVFEPVRAWLTAEGR